MADMIPYTDEDLHQATLTLVGEARGEPLAGKYAVAWVIRNRAQWSPAAWWGATPAAVCLKPWQFSCRNANDPNAAMLARLPVSAGVYQLCYGVVKDVFDGDVEDPTRGSTTYKREGTTASWDKAVDAVDPIVVDPASKHLFWRLTPDGKVLTT